MSSEALICAEHLTRHYSGTCAVNDVSFELAKGEVLGFLGPNGAGKTSTMQIISGNLAPSAGSISIMGIDLLEQPKRAKAGIGYLPERPPESIALNFMPRSTVPVLMLNGRDDFTAPVETMIRPMFAFQGAPPEHKKLVLLDGGHIPDAPIEFVREALDWLDRYLGPVQ